MTLLYVIEPDAKNHGPVIVTDSAANVVAKFFHREHSTSGVSYEEALSYATVLCMAAKLPSRLLQAEPQP